MAQDPQTNETEVLQRDPQPVLGVRTSVPVAEPDPAAWPDPSNWRTQLVQPIR
jgi:hypothetical protein